MPAIEPKVSCWAGILAAGEGRRIGQQPKALLEWRGTSFLESIARTARACGVDGICVVLGYYAGDVEPLARHITDRVTVNTKPNRGMGSSARLLARSIPEDAALLLWPVDFPAIATSTIRKVLGAAAADPHRVIAPASGSPLHGGHPPLLPPRVTKAMKALELDQRLDHFLEAKAGKPLLIEVDDPAIHIDVDSIQDLERLEEALAHEK